ncbi:MAG: hypothetical protein JOZ63_08365 [Planctomycetaceae bacterium]|nr:hypothetical protein [Planctomycetaceae bacterium]
MDTMPEPDAAPPPDPVMSSIRRADVAALEPTVGINLSGASQAGADGGIASNNRGADNGHGFGLARFGSGAEKIRGVEVKVGDPQFTLIWDTEGKPGFGGELDVDNPKGYGPENIYWLGEDGSGEKGPGPPGEYKGFVVCWRGFGCVPKPTHWKVRIKHDGKLTVANGKLRALNEQSKVYTLLAKPQTEIAVDTKETN